MATSRQQRFLFLGTICSATSLVLQLTHRVGAEAAEFQADKQPQKQIEVESDLIHSSQKVMHQLANVQNRQENGSADERQTEYKTFSGNVSWYGIPFHGRKTASGKIFDMNKLSCAHRTLPFGTRVQVENPRTGQSVVVEVIDRGPYVKGRVMDLSREAARRLGTLLGGIAYVNCLVLE